MMDDVTPYTSEAFAAATSADLVLALDGFEGPIDLLLNLAREQKVDLGKIAILPLAEQYLAFIASARKLRLEVAADYLVMAAWLAFLKSRLLLPVETPNTGEPDPAQMAEALRFQLLRLEAMQKAAQQVQALPRLGFDVFLRGMPEEVEVEEKPIYFLPIQDLLSALAAPLRRRKPVAYNIAPTRLYSIEESLERLRNQLGVMPSWSALRNFLPFMGEDVPPLERRSAIASTFAATLELVKNGVLELQQEGACAPIYLRRRETPQIVSDE
ncbi:MAG: ScpA family protein [Alphaproteobacteria bacterium]|nr:ScpA family protein [Alphaproteobacteria bacterium]